LNVTPRTENPQGRGPSQIASKSHNAPSTRTGRMDLTNAKEGDSF
jgi:hypothetical protein